MSAPPAFAPVAPLYRRALVVFGGAPALRLLAWLKPGFRHCFAAIDDGRHWITFDPLAHRIEIVAPAVDSAFDLAGYYRARGLTVVEIVPAPVPRRLAPLAPFTCVEAVKRLIGLHDRWIWTPWQLFRRLSRPVSENYPEKKLENNLDNGIYTGHMPRRLQNEPGK